MTRLFQIPWALDAGDVARPGASEVQLAALQPLTVVDFVYSQTGATTTFRGLAALTPAPTPKPATLVLLLTGAALTLLRRRAASDSTPDLI